MVDLFQLLCLGILVISLFGFDCLLLRFGVGLGLLF